MRSIISPKFGGTLSSWESLHSWVRTKIVQRSICAIDQLCWRTADLSGTPLQNCLASSWVHCTLLSISKSWRKLRQKFEEYRIVVEGEEAKLNQGNKVCRDGRDSLQESNVFGRVCHKVFFCKGCFYDSYCLSRRAKRRHYILPYYNHIVLYYTLSCNTTKEST